MMYHGFVIKEKGMMSMKKYIALTAILMLSLCFFSCNIQNEQKSSAVLFDKKPWEHDTSDDTASKETDQANDVAKDDAGKNSNNDKKPTSDNNGEKTDTKPVTPDNPKKEPEEKDDPQKENNGGTSDDNTNTGDATDTKEEETPKDAEDKDKSPADENGDTTKTEDPYSHSDIEKSTIINRYIEAEELYYDILYQQFELDGLDIVERKNSDGYTNVYHRVNYYGVNSIEELKDHYRAYFTEDFVAKLDLGSYIEENGKLYCAQTENAATESGYKYLYTVESINENNAYIIRQHTDGAVTQRIPAIKLNGEWYFGSVAIG